MQLILYSDDCYMSTCEWTCKTYYFIFRKAELHDLWQLVCMIILSLLSVNDRGRKAYVCDIYNIYT